MQQPRPPVIENNQKDMMDTLEDLSGGASGAKSDGPTTTSPEEFAPSLLHTTAALPRGLAATAPTPSNRISVEYEPYIYPTDDAYN